MDEMLNFIFGNLKNSEKSMALIRQQLNHQVRVNRRMAFLMVAAGTCGYMQHRRITRELERLRKELDEHRYQSD